MHVFYHNDPDGKCSAAIINQFYKNKEDIYFHEVDYKDDPREKFLSIPFQEAVFIVDFSFKPEVMESLLKVTNRVVWIDHHQTAKEYNYDLRGLRDFTDKGKSGCELTWEFLYSGEDYRPTPYPVILIGDYDSWRLKYEPTTFEFLEGLKSYDLNPTSWVWTKLFDPEQSNFSSQIIKEGQAIVKYRNEYCLSISRGYGYETEIDGQKAYAMNLYRFGSQQFGELFKKYPCCIAYIHDGNKFTVSLYSETIDVSEICKKYGGGGHKGAAGFVCIELPFKRG